MLDKNIDDELLDFNLDFVEHKLEFNEDSASELDNNAESDHNNSNDDVNSILNDNNYAQQSDLINKTNISITIMTEKLLNFKVKAVNKKN